MNRLNFVRGRIIIFLISHAAAVALAGDEPKAFAPFSKGERWCAIGDSITHVGGYHKYIYLYYATRFPEARFALDNCGVDGSIAKQTLARMETDIIPRDPTAATVMLGVNDVRRGPGGEGAIDDYARDLGAIIDRLRQRNCKVLVITTSPNAETSRRVAAEKKLPCLDLFALLNQLSEKMQAVDPSFTLMKPDRTHPAELGHFVMAYYFLQHQDVPAVVSRVELNASIKGLVSAENCLVDVLEFGEKAISFSLLEKALPFPVTAIPQGAVALVPFVQDFNRETLKVTGLTPGAYEILIDGTVVGVFSGNGLSNGVDLASIEATPQNRQAKIVAELNAKRHGIIADKLRYIAMIEYGELKRFYAKGDAFIARTDILARLEVIENPKRREEEKKKFDQYLDLKKQQVKLEQEAQSYDDQMWAANRPVWHNFTVRPKNTGGQ